MRRMRMIPGLNNSQKIRVIINGVGFYTTVSGALDDIIFTAHRQVVDTALRLIGSSNLRGYAAQETVYVGAKKVAVDYQIDLVL